MYLMMTSKADIEAHGGKVVGSVSSKVNYLKNAEIADRVSM